MFSNYSDEQLLSFLKEDDITAFNEMYARYSRPLYLYITGKTNSAEVTKDILQDLFTSLWEKRQTLDIHQSLKSYLYQTARYKIIDVYRRNATYRKYLQQLIEHFDAQPHHFSDALDHKTRAQEVLEAINQLPGKMKEIFMLSRFENLSIEQIASRLDLSQQTVKNQISKALKILRAQSAQADVIAIALLIEGLRH